MNRPRYWLIVSLAATLLAGCAGAAVNTSQPAGSDLNVIATTTIVADVVRQVGGEHVQVETLLPVGADPHSFDPAPRDMADIANASLIFANGAGLEAFLQPLIENAGATARVVDLSQGIDLLEGTGEEPGSDPHVWMDPNNVTVWVENVRAALSQADPQHADAYQANADRYKVDLKDLDAWIREQIGGIPEGSRKLVTDHLVFGYFARRYGLEQIGAIVPGYSTLSSPSAKELAAIESAVREYEVKAVFVGESVNPNMAQRLAEDAGIKLVYIYTGSLSAPDGPAGTYLDYMRYNVSQITTALK
jgi:ABC-type Zn uptake system ZnuABC Zn-binding protein ZnuA